MEYLIYLPFKKFPKLRRNWGIGQVWFSCWFFCFFCFFFACTKSLCVHVYLQGCLDVLLGFVTLSFKEKTRGFIMNELTVNSLVSAVCFAYTYLFLHSLLLSLLLPFNCTLTSFHVPCFMLHRHGNVVNSEHEQERASE